MANNEDTCPDSSFSCPLCQRTIPWSTPVPVTQEETHEGRLHHLPLRYGLAFLKILVPILLFKPIFTTQFKAPHRQPLTCLAHWLEAPTDAGTPAPRAHRGHTSHNRASEGVSFHLLLQVVSFLPGLGKP